MPEVTTTTVSTSTSAQVDQHQDEIIRDQHALKIKQQVMSKMRRYSMFHNISEASKFIAAPLITIGATLLITALTAVNPAANAVVIAGGLLAAGATALATAIGTGYAASRLLQSGQFDNFEINAESTARHLVKELQTVRMSMLEEHSQNARADGKKWVQVTNKEQLQPLQTQG